MAKHLKHHENRPAAPRKKRSMALPVALFAVAVALLLGSAFGSAQAALTYFSEQYDARLALPDIGITLTENGDAVSTRDYDYTVGRDTWKTTQLALVSYMEDEGLTLGKEYQEELAVTNSGTIDEYVRVKVYRYWVDEGGHKLTNLNPDLIKLNWVNIGGAWVEDESARTSERNVYYYTSILPAGDSTVNFTDTLTVSPALALSSYKEQVDEHTVRTVYTYNGVRFVIECEADAVQTHNAEDAIMSAWGVQAQLRSDGSLSYSF